MAYQNLFEALQNVCGFTALESDMFEIIDAYEKDKAEQLPQADVTYGYTQCQEDMQPLLNDLFSLWQSLAEVGEISVGKNFTKKYEELKNSLNKQD